MTSAQTTRERIGLAFATVLTALALYGVPSWLDALADPCRQALIAAALVILLLYGTRFFEPGSFAIERIVLAVFLAAMPVVYLARWLTTLSGSADIAWLSVEVVGFLIYGLLAMLGFNRSPWFLAAGIAAHGLVWDSWHVRSAYIPSWYALGCLVVDIGLGVYVAVRIAAWNRAASPVRSAVPAS